MCGLSSIKSPPQPEPFEFKLGVAALQTWASSLNMLILVINLVLYIRTRPLFVFLTDEMVLQAVCATYIYAHETIWSIPKLHKT